MHELPALPYAYDALEPHIDAQTMEIHHGKHHKAYVDNLHKALADHPELAAMSINELLRNLTMVPDSARGAVRNNGGGHLNHTMFWESMKAGGGGEPSGALMEAIERDLASFDQFKQTMQAAGVGR